MSTGPNLNVLGNWADEDMADLDVNRSKLDSQRLLGEQQKVTNYILQALEID